MKQIARTFGKTFLSLCLLLGGFVVTQHVMPPEIIWATPESPDAAPVSKAQKAFDKAMEQCKKLPKDTLPGGVVMDTVDKKAFYSEDAHTVDAGFEYAIAKYTKADVIPGDSYIVGVTLCR